MNWSYPRSLQTRLMLSLLLATGLVWCAALAMTSYETEHELAELLDAHLAQTAAVLSTQTGDEHDSDFTTAPILHKYQPRVAFQIWHERELIARSAYAPSMPLAPWGSVGISDQHVAGQSWRVFVTSGRQADVTVVVAELSSARNDILLAGLYSAIGPVLVALPVLALLIGWIVFKALAPLRQLSQSVSQRHPHALSALPLQGVSAEVQPLVLALNRLFERMTQQIEGERRFTADAAHELRTPIAAIRMQAQVACGAKHDEERSQALSSVLKGCDRATRLVSQLLELARLDAVSSSASSDRCDALLETRDILAQLGPRAVASQQVLSCQAPSTLTLPMPAALLGVLVGNLVDNAMRYSPPGSQIAVVWSDSPVPRLVVEDGGAGMRDEEMARLGDRFLGVCGHTADGSGLGWSIVRRLAHRYRLTVQVGRSAQWGGLRVEVSWPEL